MRFKNLANGRRQILNLLLPGDICDLQGLVDTRADHSVTTLTPAMICEVDKARFREVLATEPEIANALLWSVVQEEGILREPYRAYWPAQRPCPALPPASGTRAASGARWWTK